MAAKIPTLEYRWLDKPGHGIVSMSTEVWELADVHEVTVSVWTIDGPKPYLVIFARGRMLKRDGEPGPSRGIRVDVEATQPTWLADIIADARKRLPEAEGATP